MQKESLNRAMVGVWPTVGLRPARQQWWGVSGGWGAACGGAAAGKCTRKSNFAMCRERFVGRRMLCFFAVCNMGFAVFSRHTTNYQIPVVTHLNGLMKLSSRERMIWKQRNSMQRKYLSAQWK